MRSEHSTQKMDDRPARILLKRAEIQERIRSLGEQITLEMQGLTPCIMPILDGGMIFTSDLIRQISLPITLLPIKASSYGQERVSSGRLELPLGVSPLARDQDVLLVDDILDTGLTLTSLCSSLLAAGARSVRTCVLLRKQHAVHLHADYIGFDIPNEFVVGYGLDHAGHHRNLPDIRCLETRKNPKSLNQSS